MLGDADARRVTSPCIGKDVMATACQVRLEGCSGDAARRGNNNNNSVAVHGGVRATTAEAMRGVSKWNVECDVHVIRRGTAEQSVHGAARSERELRARNTRAPERPSTRILRSRQLSDLAFVASSASAPSTSVHDLESGVGRGCTAVRSP